MVGPVRAALRELGITSIQHETTQPQQTSQHAGTTVTVAVDLESNAVSDTTAAVDPEIVVSGTSAATGSAAWRDSLTAQQQRSVYHPVRVEKVECFPRPCVMVSLTLPDGDGAVGIEDQMTRELYWEEFCEKILPLEGVVVFIWHGQPLLFGTVVSNHLCCHRA